METAIFVVCAAIVLGGAFGVVFSRNPVHSALSLVATLFGIAVLFLNLGAQLLAAVQVIVYTGAIVVLILFVLMLLGVDREEDLNVQPLVGQGVYAFVVAALIGAGILSVILIGGSNVVTGASSSLQALAPDYGNIRQIGDQLFTNYVFALEVTAALLDDRRRRRRGVGPTGPGPTAAPRARTDRGARRRDPLYEGRGRGLMRNLDLAYLALGAVLFSIGAGGVLYRRNSLVMIMCVELMLNAVNLTFVSFGKMLNDTAGQVIVFFVLVVAAAEVVVGLGLVVAVTRRKPNANADDLTVLRG